MFGRSAPHLFNRPRRLHSTGASEQVGETTRSSSKHYRSSAIAPTPTGSHLSASARNLARSGMMLANGEALNRPSVTREEMEEFKQIFDMLDEANAESQTGTSTSTDTLDKSGYISGTELAHYTKSIGMQFEQQELESMIAENDQDGDGQLNFEEFWLTLKKMSGIRHQTTWDDVIKQCFFVFDRNEAGSISEDDFRQVMIELGGITEEDVLEKVFAEADVDGNGLIEYEEFSAMVRSYMKEEDLVSSRY